MQKIRWSQRQTELGLVAAGLVGLVTAALAACGTDTTSTSTDDGGTTSADGATAPNDATTTGDGASVSGKCTLADTSENTKAVVAAANALSAALTAEQRTAIQYEKTLANAQQWSNFPTTFVKRNGVRLADMSVEARAAAVALAEAAAGAQGAKLLSELRAADQWLVTDGKASSTDYGDEHAWAEPTERVTAPARIAFPGFVFSRPTLSGSLPSPAFPNSLSPQQYTSPVGVRAHVRA